MSSLAALGKVRGRPRTYLNLIVDLMSRRHLHLSIMHLLRERLGIHFGF